MVIFYSYVSVPEGITRLFCWESLGGCICIDKTLLLVASCCESSIFVFVYFCWVQLVNAGISNMSVKSSTSPNSQNSMKGQSESTIFIIFRGVFDQFQQWNPGLQMFPSSQVPNPSHDSSRGKEVTWGTGRSDPPCPHYLRQLDHVAWPAVSGGCWEVILGWCWVYSCKYLCM